MRANPHPPGPIRWLFWGLLGVLLLTMLLLGLEAAGGAWA